MALNLKKMEEELDRALAKETKESLLAWLDKKRGEVSEFGVEQQVKPTLAVKFYCQREIENESKCDEQCEHCREYYKPLEGFS